MLELLPYIGPSQNSTYTLTSILMEEHTNGQRYIILVKRMPQLVLMEWEWINHLLLWQVTESLMYR
jgi:hypothetical protein